MGGRRKVGGDLTACSTHLESHLKVLSVRKQDNVTTDVVEFDNLRIAVRFTAGKTCFYLLHNYQITLRPTQPPTQ